MTGVPSPLDLDRLLAEQDFVRRLARSLVFDQQRVDDVVQETWLACMQRPPRDPRAVATWFGRVVHNLARRGSRDAKRRREHEAAVARTEALPSAVDVIEREQERRRVVDAVLTLAEPYRGTVLARFFDDLPPREIARRRGVPAATVRSQLLRGLEMVRQRLDDLHGGNRQSWALGLLPLARPARVGALGLGTLTGAFLMTKLLLAAGATALALFMVMWWNRDDGLANVAPPAPNDAPATAVADAIPAAAGVAGGSLPSEREPVAAASAATAPFTGLAGMRGRVVHADGQPAADRSVRVLGIDGVTLFADAATAGDARTLPLPRAATRTGADGTFVVAGLVAHTRYAVHADVDGPERTLRLVDVTPVPDAVVDIGDFVLAAKGALRGRAVDANGAPVAGAEVLALDLPAAIAAVAPFDRFRPECGGMLSMPLPDDKASDVATYHERLNEYLARDLFERADLDREAGLATFVVDRLPWLEALWQELPIARTRTDADGRFQLGGVEPGGSLLIVRRAGLASGVRPRVLVQASVTKDVGDVELGAGEAIRVVVRDADRRPVRGAEVRVATFGALGYRGVAFAEAPVVTDDNGEALVGGLPRGRAFVAARRDAAAPWVVHGPVATDDDVALELATPCTLAVQVVGGDGSPAADPTLEVFEGPPLGELQRAGLQHRLPIGARSTATAEAGIAVRNLQPGCYTLEIGAPGMVPVTTMVELPRSEPLRVVLAAARRVTAIVRDHAGAPLPGAKLYLATEPAARAVLPTSYGLPHWTSLPRWVGATDAAGRLVVEVPARGATLHAVHPHRAPSSATVGGDDDEVAIVLPPTGELRGRLYVHGTPADQRRFRIVARPMGGSDVPLPEVRTGLAVDGTFAFAELAPRHYALRAEAIAAEPLTMRSLVDNVKDLVFPTWGAGPIETRVQVIGGATATIEFDVDPNQPPPGILPARLRGHVAIDGRAPTEVGLQLQRRADEGRFVDAAAVAADGTFVVDATAPGHAALRLRRADDVLWEGEVDLVAGEEHVLELGWSTGTLIGQLSFPAGFPVAGYGIRARVQTAGGIAAREVGSDAAGRFRFEALPAGTVELRASGRDGKSEPVRIELAAGTTATAQLELHEVLVLTGRIEIDVHLDSIGLLFLSSERLMWGTSLATDGSFAFSDLPPDTYTLLLTTDGQTIALTPDRFDLADGQSRRDVVVHVTVTKPAGR